MNREQIKFIQKLLNEKNANLIVDGKAGVATNEAVRRFEEIPESWSDERSLVGFIQLVAEQEGLDFGLFDGYWGAKTAYAYNQLLSNRVTGESFDVGIWPVQSQDELVRFYGAVGENQIHISLPYPHKLAWETGTIINSYSCHEKVHDSLKRVLTRTLSHYGTENIVKLRLDLWGGCLNVRKMRGGSSYSTHSWGIAVDYDPAHNRLKWGRDQASFSKHEYNAWWTFWEDEGWVSLGRTKNRDWMHVQAVKL